jgi:transglutaminase/protease-like cytokinesis protein 3
MKSVLYLSAGIVTLLMGSASFAQKKFIVSTDTISPSALAQQLTAPYSTDRQKVTAIFRWIADNISYNVRSKNKNNTALIYDEPEDTSRFLKPLNERVAEIVLRMRKAVCDGYSRLFKTLCDHAGISSEIITGYVRVNWGKGGSKFRSNHKWNAVLIDSVWYLVDVTWASGLVTYRGDEFIQEYNDRYFLTPPELFIRDHYPEDIAWTLLPTAPSIVEFYYSPFRYTGFIKSGITSYLPSKGIIEASIGDSIRFEIEATGGNKILFVSDTPPVDPDEPYASYDPDEPVIAKGIKKAGYTYTVTNKSSEWLYVICNGEIIMRYRLNIKKAETKTAMLLHE